VITIDFNQYGGSLGGPIWKNRIFAFFNWETSPLSGHCYCARLVRGLRRFDALGLRHRGSIAAQYLSFPGNSGSRQTRFISAVPGGSIGPCRRGPIAIPPRGAWDLGSPLTTGLGLQDLSYGGNAGTPGVWQRAGWSPRPGVFQLSEPNQDFQIDAVQRPRRREYYPRRTGSPSRSYWVPVSDHEISRARSRPPKPLQSTRRSTNAFSLIWTHTFLTDLAEFRRRGKRRRLALE